jgi:hypothetical protein
MIIRIQAFQKVLKIFAMKNKKIKNHFKAEKILSKLMLSQNILITSIEFHYASKTCHKNFQFKDAHSKEMYANQNIDRALMIKKKILTF